MISSINFENLIRTLKLLIKSIQQFLTSFMFQIVMHTINAKFKKNTSKANFIKETYGIYENAL